MVFILLLFTCLSFANEVLQPIGNHSGRSLESFDEKTLFVFFQANCSACQMQIKDLKCLEKNYSINLLGSISKLGELKKEYQKYKVSYPAYFADPIAMAKLPIEIAATPQIIIWSKPKPKLFMGYKACEKYKKIIKGS